MSRQDQFMEALFTRYRWVLHLIFWIAVLAFYVLFFGRRTSNYVQTMFFFGAVDAGDHYNNVSIKLLPRYPVTCFGVAIDSSCCILGTPGGVSLFLVDHLPCSPSW